MDFFLNQESLAYKNAAQTTKLFRILKFVKFIKALRLLRAFKLKNIFCKIEDFLQLSAGINAFLTVFKLSFMIIIIAHWCACIWHFLAIIDKNEKRNTWLQVLNLVDESWEIKLFFFFKRK